MRSDRIHVGTSGWTYRAWRGDFYPAGLRQRDELAYLAARTTSLEVNGSFYSLRRPATYAGWRAAVPPQVDLAVKGSRFITHMKKLAGVETALANFFASGVLALGEQLGPVLWQLPASVRFDTDRLGPFLDSLPRTHGEVAALARGHDARVADDAALTAPTGAAAEHRVRHALEPRHDSFGSDAALRVLRDADVACVLADSAGRWPALDADTSDFRYVRLHGATELYTSGYDDAELDAWAARCRGWAAAEDVHVYFDNDARGHAPWDAVGLLARLDPDPAPLPPGTRPRPT